ncbi:MAG: 3-methyl-2-oxobutanoate hydroxymethyltransferase [Anaerolineae bacterium]|nr:3-methyl-2-oxobutanoate hydroxymethyltransferase [Anaerolineae bacterium]
MTAASRTTVRDFQKMKAEGTPIAMLTAYDETSARLGELAGVNALLVGDTLGMVIQGHQTTLPVTLDHIIYHAQIVTRVTTVPFIIGDMPFMTYNISPEQAMANAGRLMQESGVGAVKMEGGASLAPTIARIVQAGIPVMGHIGLQPQSVHKYGGMRVQGRDDAEDARRLLADAHAVQDAGAFAMVVEGVPVELGKMITEQVHIPTIGIAAGPHCDGQVQVFHDLLGLFDAFKPRHVRRYIEGAKLFREAIASYVDDVQNHRFPTAEHAFAMKPDVLAALTSMNGADED